MKITIYSTRGQQKFEHTSSATTFGELKEELRGEYDFESLNATESITRRTLMVDSAEIPQEDFILFLSPKSSKLGVGTSNLEKLFVEVLEKKEKVFETKLKKDVLEKMIRAVLDDSGYKNYDFDIWEKVLCDDEEDEEYNDEETFNKIFKKFLEEKNKGLSEDIKKLDDEANEIFG